MPRLCDSAGLGNGGTGTSEGGMLPRDLFYGVGGETWGGGLGAGGGRKGVATGAV